MSSNSSTYPIRYRNIGIITTKLKNTHGLLINILSYVKFKSHCKVKRLLIIQLFGINQNEYANVNRG